MIVRSVLISSLLLLAKLGIGQSIVGLPTLTQIGDTSFELFLRTDSAAVVTVHTSHDTTYSNAFVFLGRTIGSENKATIQMEGLKDSTDYYYRVFIGQELSPAGGSFRTGGFKK